MTEPENPRFVVPGGVRARRGASFAQVMGAFSFVLLLAFGGGVYLYFAHVAYQRVATRHLPADTRVAARLDVETLLVLGPLRDHLLPLFDLGVPAGHALKSRHDRFRAHTGVELARDLRELVVGVGATPASWVLIVGGKFPRTGMVDGLELVLREEQAQVRRSGSELLIEGGPAIGQALDGSLIVASDPARLTAALAGSEAFLTLGLPPEGAGGFAAGFKNDGPPELPGLERVSGAFRIGTELEIDGALRFAGDTPRSAEAVTGGVRELAQQAPVHSGVARVLAESAVQPRRPNELAIRGTVHPDELDLAARWLAEAIRSHFALVPSR